MNKLHWFCHRLRKMRPAELPYRVWQSLKKKYDRGFSPVPALGDQSNWRANINEAAVSFAGEHSSLFKEALLERAEDALSHTYSFFGLTRGFGDPIDWHLDPKTGKRWPLKFWSGMNYRDGQAVGGIKFAWELNRLHHFPILALAYQLTGEERFRGELFEEIESWLDGNPYHKGINWISGIELGIRVVNLVYAIEFLGSDTLDRKRRELVAKFVSLHGWRLYRYPSRYSSCNNHAIAEALGAFTAGLCFPDLPGARKWKRFGKSVLEREVTRQIYPDGSSCEHTTLYLQFVLDHFLIYFLLCREHGELCGSQVKERIIDALEFIDAIIDDKGNMPAIGDEDDGYLLKMDVSGQSNFVSLLNTGAVLFDRPEWILPNARYDLKTHCLLGNTAEEQWADLKRRASSREANCQFFENAGLAVIRAGDAGRSIFIGNSGPLGQLPLAGHGHADALSFTLTVNGQPVIVDPGTYLYHSSGKWRRYFRSTGAHSTIRIDEEDQAPIVTDFMFGRFYKIIYTEFETEADRVVWAAAHDGYTRLRDPVEHKRVVTYHRKESRFVIEDRVACRGEHLVESFLHFHPTCLVSLDDHAVLIENGGVRLHLGLDEKWESCEIVTGVDDPLSGWFSAGFNRLEKTSTLSCRKTIRGTQTFRCAIHLNGDPKLAGVVKQDEQC